MNGNVIILPHSFWERLPNRQKKYLGWPGGDGHARKFLRSKGNWVKSDGKSGQAWLEFWCEYEAPTSCEFIESGEGFPNAIQKPVTDFGKPGMNTDPWVFHPGFVWSICRHGSVRNKVNPGDIVLFGSSKKGNWYLDTVMVIKERLSSGAGVIGGVFDKIIHPPFLGPYAPFVGQEFQRISEPFSFVPVKVANNGHSPFARPSINSLLELLRLSNGNPPSPKNCRALAFCKFDGGVSAFWNKLVKEIEDAGLLLGTSFQHPGDV